MNFVFGNTDIVITHPDAVLVLADVAGRLQRGTGFALATIRVAACLEVSPVGVLLSDAIRFFAARKRIAPVYHVTSAARVRNCCQFRVKCLA